MITLTQRGDTQTLRLHTICGEGWDRFFSGFGKDKLLRHHVHQTIEVSCTNRITIHRLSTDTTPPSVPTNLSAFNVDTGGGELWLRWIQASDETDAQNNIEYEIYVNGVLSPLPVSAGVDYDFVYALPGCENTFTVKAVDQSGNTSGASTPIKVQFWVCPN